MRICLGITRFFFVMAVGLIALFSVPRFFGVKIFYVSSGSMMPMLQVGDAIFVKCCNIEEVKEQDIVTYCFSQSDTRITHRVLKLDREQGIMLTKGDANDRTDEAWISGECLIGKVIFHMHGFGTVAYLLSLRLGKLLAAGVLLWLLALQNILEQWIPPKGRRNSRRRKRTEHGRKR